MAKTYTPQVKFANSGSTAGKGFNYVQTLEKTSAYVSDHAVAPKHFTGVVRFKRDWRPNVVNYMFKPVPAVADPHVSIPSPAAFVTLSGSNFMQGATVNVVGSDFSYPGTSVTVLNEHVMTFQAPDWPREEHVTIVVTNPTKFSGSNPDIFFYERYPVLVPPAVPTASFIQGDVAVALSGFYFKRGSLIRVRSGSYFALSSDVTYNSDVNLIALTPPVNATGSYQLSVISPSGLESNAVPFTYVYRAPEIVNLLPSQGATDGGTLVGVIGRYFLSGAQITIGTSSLAETFFSDASMSFTTPAAPVGLKNVVVTNPDGQVSAPFAFSFILGLPTITSIFPSSGVSGSVFTVNGNYFSNGPAVITSARLVPTNFVGSYNVPTFNVASNILMSITMPTVPLGNYYLYVSSTSGEGSSYPNKISFVVAPGIAYLNPSSGGTAGGFYVDVTGSTFDPTSVWRVGGAVVSATYISSTNVRIPIMPAHASGTVAITVTTSGLPSGSANFTYVVSPSITSGTVWYPDIGR